MAHRRRKHCNSASLGSSLPIHRAIRKYGDSIKWEVLDKADSWEELCSLEKFYISKFNSLQKGLNCTAGGEGLYKRVHTEETKKKISKAHTGKRRSQEFRDKISKVVKGSGNPFYGKKHSEEAKKLISLKSNKKSVKGTHKITGEVIYLESMSCDPRFSKNGISNVIRGKAKTHKSYFWELTDGI